MVRSMLCTAVLLGCGLVAGAVAAPPQARAVVGTALAATPQSRMEGNQAIDAATAAALVGAISTEFGERNVQVKLDKVDLAPDSIVQREVSGAGRLLIGNDLEWIPFRFSALYDTEQASVGYPKLVLGDDSAGSPISRTSPLAIALASQVNQRLRAEFGQQSSGFSPESIRLVPLHSRFMGVEAIGTATFDGEGTTGAGVHALYDPRNHEWLRVTYELGATANRGSEAAAVASR
jgi:hypothetical protein